MRSPRLTVLLLAGALAAPPAHAATPPPTMRWVQATSLMLRAEPSTQARILERLPQGHRVDLPGPPAAGAEWCEVQGAGPLRYTGYVACRYLSEQPVAPLKAGEGGVPPDHRWVTGSRLQLRAEPRAEAPVLASLALNTVVRLTGPDAAAGYCAVQLVDRPGLSGHTACRYLDRSPVNALSLATPVLADGAANPDFNPARAFWIAPSWDLMAHYAFQVEQQRALLGDKAPRGPDEQLERMKARLSGEVVSVDDPPRVWPEWARLLKPLPGDGAPSLGLEGYDRDGDAAPRTLALLKALPALPEAAPSWWTREDQLAAPGESIAALAARFGGQVVALHESLQPGSPHRGEVAPGARIDRLTQPLRRISLLADQTVRDERAAPQRTYRDWDPTSDVNCDGWVGGFSYGTADRATLLRNGFEAPPAGRVPVLFQLWSNRPLPAGPARWTRQVLKLDRGQTGFVSGEWRTVDLDNDGIPDLAWLQATGRGPGHLDGPPPHDDPWYRLLLANVAGRWRLLEVDTFGYGCGC